MPLRSILGGFFVAIDFIHRFAIVSGFSKSDHVIMWSPSNEGGQLLNNMLIVDIAWKPFEVGILFAVCWPERVSFMASPQTEKGYTRVANEILEELSTVKMSGSEWQFLMCLFRKTYGFHKKHDWISVSQIEEITSLRRERVSEAKARLLQRHIIVEKDGNIGFQKDYDKWIDVRKSVPIRTEKRTKVVRKSVPTKERKIKDTSEVKTSPKKDMSFNKTAEDYEEGVISDDGDGSLTEKKKPTTKKYPNAPDVRKIFLEVIGKCPANWRMNKTQLQACENLYTERGLKSIKNALRWYQEHKDMEYCPQVSAPYDLDSKWTKLATFKKKYGN